MENEVASDREIVTTRTFNVGQEQLYTAWANPEILGQWWGPTGNTNIFHKFEFRPLGDWHFTMQGPDGAKHSNVSKFVSMKAFSKIVWDHLSKPEFQVIATFDEVTPTTSKCTFRMVFANPADCEAAKVHAVEANEENFDRLEAVLARVP